MVGMAIRKWCVKLAAEPPMSMIVNAGPRRHNWRPSARRRSPTPCARQRSTCTRVPPRVPLACAALAATGLVGCRLRPRRSSWSCTAMPSSPARSCGFRPTAPGPVSVRWRVDGDANERAIDARGDRRERLRRRGAAFRPQAGTLRRVSRDAQATISRRGRAGAALLAEGERTRSIFRLRSARASFSPTRIRRIRARITAAASGSFTRSPARSPT